MLMKPQNVSGKHLKNAGQKDWQGTLQMNADVLTSSFLNQILLTFAC
jgi:hypothetical protein